MNILSYDTLCKKNVLLFKNAKDIWFIEGSTLLTLVFAFATVSFRNAHFFTLLSQAAPNMV